MKLFISILILFATPTFSYAVNVGDKAHMTAQIDSNNPLLLASLLQEVIAFDAATNSCTVRTTFEIFGSSEVQEEVFDVSKVLSKEDGAEKVKNCASLNGELETITVSAGTFETCKLSESEEEVSRVVWYGPVSFGKVKSIVTHNGSGDQTFWQLESWQ